MMSPATIDRLTRRTQTARRLAGEDVRAWLGGLSLGGGLLPTREEHKAIARLTHPRLLLAVSATQQCGPETG